MQLILGELLHISIHTYSIYTYESDHNQFMNNVALSLYDINFERVKSGVWLIEPISCTTEEGPIRTKCLVHLVNAIHLFSHFKLIDNLTQELQHSSCTRAEYMSKHYLPITV